MKFEIEYSYVENIIPPRCRKPRPVSRIGIMDVEIEEIASQKAPVAIITTDCTKSTEFRLWNDQLWKAAQDKDYRCTMNGILTLDGLQDYIKGYDSSGLSQEENIALRMNRASEFSIIDGVIYQKAKEPRYVVITFGLGHNYGSTDLMLADEYNPNISKNRYFNSLEREEAIAKANEVAIARGDTESIGRIGMHWNIQVLMSEAVKCNPHQEIEDVQEGAA